MSMPSFPENPDISREQALDMLLAALALQELAFSHVINAEGEKIQYMLKPCYHTDTNDLLAVNKSVNTLLNTVMENQIFLKNNLEKILDHIPSPPAAPSFGCGSSCATPFEFSPSCGHNNMLLMGPPAQFNWKPETAFPWSNCCGTGEGIIWDTKHPCKLFLSPGCRYEISLLMLCAPRSCGQSVFLAGETPGPPLLRGYPCKTQKQDDFVSIYGKGILTPDSFHPLSIRLFSAAASELAIYQACMNIIRL